MKVKEIQDLLDFIAKSGLAEVHLETDQFKLEVKKYPEVSASSFVHQAPVVQTQAPAPTVASTQIAQEPVPTKTEAQTPEAGQNLITIKSPMIGTFYRSPNPESPSFVNVGDEIKVGQAVCIIEAMKLFNEIESEIAGKVVKILVENATPVEYDQPLFLVEPK